MYTGCLAQRKPSVSGICSCHCLHSCSSYCGQSWASQMAGSWRGSPGGRPPPSQLGWRGVQPSGARQQYPPAASGRSLGAHSGAIVKLRTGKWEGTSARVHTKTWLELSQDKPWSSSWLKRVASVGSGLHLLGIEKPSVDTLYLTDMKEGNHIQVSSS